MAGFETSREAFLGPYRGWDRPLAVERGAMAGSIAHGWQPIGALQATLVLDPGESRDVTFVLGYTENPADAQVRPARLRPAGHVAGARGRSTATGEPGRSTTTSRRCGPPGTERLGALQVATGDPHVDRMVNTWNPYQCMVTFNLSRSASMFESGIGRGMGFRDSNQDLLGFVHMVPERARARILDIAATQLPDGGAYHQYQPLTKRGNHDVGSGFNDDPAWLVLGVAAYLKETGDLAILDEPVPWDNAEGSETPLPRPPAAVHRLHARAARAARAAADRAGGLERLPQPQRLLRPARASPSRRPPTAPAASPSRCSSPACSCSPRARRRRSPACAATRPRPSRCARRPRAMTAAIEAHGWDGAWYRRAYDHVGRPVGSAANDEGQIFIEPQGMMAMAGVGLDDGRTRTALASVRERLATPHGIVLQQPAYATYHLELGEISSYPPGLQGERRRSSATRTRG